MPKPNEFYVGVLDFFAILLPGGVAVAILEPILRPYVVGPLIIEPTSAAAWWTLFVVLAYFLGHLIFQLGSHIDWFYNQIRERLNPYDNESAYQCATRIKDSVIAQEESRALNTFQWARSVLILKHPAGAADVHRLEADSKFFRSLLVVSLFGFFVFAFDQNVQAALGALLISMLCFNRYYDRRLKSTTQAYIHIVTMHRLGMLVNDNCAIPPDSTVESDA